MNLSAYIHCAIIVAVQLHKYVAISILLFIIYAFACIVNSLHELAYV